MKKFKDDWLVPLSIILFCLGMSIYAFHRAKKYDEKIKIKMEIKNENY